MANPSTPVGTKKRDQELEGMNFDSLDNPLTEGLRLVPRPAPCAVVFFGATGDLTRRKLMPGLFNLARQGLLPQCFRVIGISRSDLADEQFRDSVRTGLAEFASVGPSESELLGKLSGRFDLHPGRNGGRRQLSTTRLASPGAGRFVGHLGKSSLFPGGPSLRLRSHYGGTR